MVTPVGRLSTASDRAALEGLDAIEAWLEPLDRSIVLAEWNLYTGRSQKGSTGLNLRRARLLGSERLLDFARRATHRLEGSPAARRAQLLERQCLDAAVEQLPEIVRLRDRLQRRIVAFRPRWKGRRVGRGRIYEELKGNRNRSARKDAWYAEEPLYRTLEEPVRRLVRLRNEGARRLGERSFAHLRLRFEGFSPSSLRQVLERIRSVTPRVSEPLVSGFQRRESLEDFLPWDLAYARESGARLPSRLFPVRAMDSSIRFALKRWGFSERVLRFPIVRHDVPFGGLTFSPSAPTDSRILIHPGGGWYSYLVLFHEAGHAVHSRSVGASSHLLRSTDLGFAGMNEGVADFFEELSSSREWLESRDGLTSDQVSRFRESRRFENLIAAASMLLGVELELDLYEHPDRDPTPAARARSQRLFGFADYRPRSLADPFLVTHPVYMQSYVFAQCFRAQLQRAAQERLGGAYWPNRRLGPWLTSNLLAPGATYDWVGRIREVTGRPFGPDDLIRSVERSRISDLDA